MTYKTKHRSWGLGQGFQLGVGEPVLFWSPGPGVCVLLGEAGPCRWVIRFFMLLHGSTCLQRVPVGAQQGGLEACWGQACQHTWVRGMVCSLGPGKLWGLELMGKGARLSL